ncbi:MAG: prepilin peptidase [Candidatus Omnitrophica bacterium]|nr:prepilin peptidase [Candidatus Omnitrophota bacterium]
MIFKFNCMPLTHLLLFVVVAVIGGIVVTTDLKERRIYNIHLAMGFLAGSLVLLYATLIRREDMNIHFINGIAAALIGFIFFHYKEWRGGDAKLFMLFSFLMPLTGQENKYYLTSIVFFSSTFIAGSIIVVPLLIHDGVLHWKEIFIKENCRRELGELRQALLGSFLLSWLLFPVYFLLRMPGDSAVALILTFIVWCVFRGQGLPEIRFRFQVFMMIFVGLAARLFLAPGMLSAPMMMNYFGRIVVWSAVFVFMNIILKNLKTSKDRLPFAFFLVVGCVLSYTPFLSFVVRH